MLKNDFVSFEQLGPPSQKKMFVGMVRSDVWICKSWVKDQEVEK